MPPLLDLSRVSILVLESDAKMQTLLKEVLYGLGFRVIFACADLGAALSLLQVGVVKLVFADIDRCGEEGLEFIESVRRLEPKLAATPVIALSSDATMRRVEEARSAGAMAFLAKPISIGAIADHVAYALTALPLDGEPDQTCLGSTLYI